MLKKVWGWPAQQKKSQVFVSQQKRVGGINALNDYITKYFNRQSQVQKHHFHFPLTLQGSGCNLEDILNYTM